MGKTSRTKGAAGEREFARLVRTHGFDCERTGRNGRTSEDVTHSIPGLHIEVKRDERLSVDAMVRQAERDAADGLVPVVAFRRNRQPWRVVVDADEYLRLKEIEIVQKARYATTMSVRDVLGYGKLYDDQDAEEAA